MSRLVDYEMVRRLGQGGQADVWLARRLGPVGQDVALKRISVGRDVDRRATLEAEARLLATIDHVNVLRLLDVIVEPDELILVTQFAPGGSVADLLTRRGRLSSSDVSALLAPTAAALASIHRQGIVHGDVKPANILLTADGAPLLADFGVARWHDLAPAAHGTGHYVAPELLDGGAPASSADVFALGITAVEMLTGDVGGMVDDSPVPTSLARLVGDMVAEDPAERPTAMSVADALNTMEPSSSLRPVFAAESAPVEIAAGTASSVAVSSATPPATREFGPRPPIGRTTRENSALRWPIVVVLFVVVIITLATLLV